MLCTVLSRSVMSDSLWPHGLLPVRLPCPWEFSRQEYWIELPCPPPKDLPNPGIKPRSPALQADSLPSEPIILQIKEKNLRPTFLGRSCDFTHSIIFLLLCNYYILCTAKAIWGIQKKFHESSHSLFIVLLIHSETVLNTYWLLARF